jgi:hypothetical protein
MDIAWQATLSSPNVLLGPDRLALPSYTIWEYEKNR